MEGAGTVPDPRFSVWGSKVTAWGRGRSVEGPSTRYVGTQVYAAVWASIGGLAESVERVASEIEAFWLL